jgi:hypothetical protein
MPYPLPDCTAFARLVLPRASLSFYLDLEAKAYDDRITRAEIALLLAFDDFIIDTLRHCVTVPR